MEHVADLPAKLKLLLQSASISRVALAQKLGVDKSLIGRWLAGSVHPTEHNLTRLTAAFAERFGQLSLADWHGDLADFATRLGLRLPEEKEGFGSELPAPVAAFLAASRSETELRARAYEGFWRTARPSLLMEGTIFHDYGMIRRTRDGLVEVRMSGSGLSFAGLLFVMAGNIFVFLHDATGQTPITVYCKGVTLPKAVRLEGIISLAALDTQRTLAALPILVERVGDLSGDPAMDDEWFARIGAEKPEPVSPLPPGRIESRLFRATGAQARKGGDDGFLKVDSTGSLSEGTTELGLSG